MLAELSSLIEGSRILLLGVGNRLRGDDAVGSLLIERLQGKVDIPMIDAGDVPENYLGPIEDSGAEIVLVVDAADIGAKAGNVAIFNIEQIKNISSSTHTTNLGLLFQVIPTEKRPRIIILGIQPENLEIGQNLSEPVLATLAQLEKVMLALNKRCMRATKDLHGMF